MATKPKNPIASNAEKALMQNKFYQKATAKVDGRTGISKAKYGKSMMKKGGIAKTKLKTYPDGGEKGNSRTQVTKNGKTTTTTTNEKGKKDYIHTGSSTKKGSETYFTGKDDKYYEAGKMSPGRFYDKPGIVEYSQPGFSKNVDTTGYAAGKNEFIVKSNLKKPGGKTTTSTKTISRSQVQPMLNRWQSKASEKKTGGATKMKTGGMVNANSAIKKQTVPGSKGVISGENPKAAASKVAKGRSGGTSKAPKTAMPKAKYGMSMKKK